LSEEGETASFVSSSSCHQSEVDSPRPETCQQILISIWTYIICLSVWFKTHAVLSHGSCALLHTGSLISAYVFITNVPLSFNNPKTLGELYKSQITSSRYSPTHQLLCLLSA
jgi:hypothetical protein